MEHIESKLQKKKKRLKKYEKEENETIEQVHSSKMEHFKELQETILPEKIKLLEKYNSEILNKREAISRYEKLYNQEYSLLKNDSNLYEKYKFYFETQSMHLLKKYSESKIIKNLYKYYTKIEYYKNLDENIVKLQNEINDIKNRKEEYDYILDTNDILFRYYANNMHASKELLDEYFSAISSKKEVIMNETRDYSYKYICNKCNVVLLMDDKTCSAFCEKCGFSIINIMQNSEYSNLSYKEKQEQTVQTQKFFYQRKQYFKECLNRIQGKEIVDIPENIIEDIKNQMKIENINIKQIDYNIIRKFLKLKGHSVYYEHIPYIIRLITGDYQLNIPKDIEELLMYIFNVVDQVYNKIKPPKWKNTIPINYYFYKFSEMLGYMHFLPFFPLLKDKKKIHERDLMWEEIIKYIINIPENEYQLHYHVNYTSLIKWKFIKTV